MVVGHLSELISATVGSEKRHVWWRRPRASRAPVRWHGLLVIHSVKSFTSGMLGIAETSKIQAGVAEYWVTASGGDAEFIKKRRSSKTVRFRTCLQNCFM